MPYNKTYKYIIGAIIIGLNFLLMSCSKENISIVDASSACREIKLAQGQELLLTLASNPSTGYGWSIDKKPAFLEILQEAVYKQDAADGVGVGGKTSWKFKVIANGNDSLVMSYRRPWEKDVPPAERFVCKFVVN